MEKTKHTIRVSPTTARELKVMAAQAGLSQGDLLAALLQLHREGRLTDEEFTRALGSHHARTYTLPQGVIR